MSDRFERLYKLPENLYVKGSPIIISAGALLKDRETGKVIVQLKFHSVTNSLIKGVKLSLNAYDISGTEIEGVDDYQYLDLSVRNGQDFGSKKAIFMPDAVTRSFAMKKLTVIMSSGDIVDVPVTMHPLPSKRSLQSELNNTELVKQYNIATNPSALYVPQESHHLWMCACGEWNNSNQCTKCQLPRENVFSSYDLESLTEKMNARLKNEQERLQEEKRKEEQQRLLEEKELIKKREEDKERKILITKKIKKIICVSTPIILSILVFSLWLWPKVLQPAIIYKDAEMMLSAEQYDEAISVFKSLDDYKDAPEMVKEALYRKALLIAENNDYKEAIDILEELDGYAESNNYLTTLKHQYAEILFNQGNYDEAKSIYQSIIKFKNSAEMIQECDYQKALNLFNEKQYEDAINIYLQIEDYKDVTKKIPLCKYNLSLKKMDNSNYKDAIDILVELGNYKDSQDQLLEAKYQLAKQYISNGNVDGDYQAAIVLLEELGKYKDSITYKQLISQVNNRIYQTHDNFQYWYLWVRTIIDVDKCSIEVIAQEARSNDLVRIGEQKYSIDYVWKFEEWKRENGNYLMVFEGSNPSEDRKSYREWTISSNWKTIRSQSMTYNGKILGESGEYVDNYSQITDADIAKKLIDNFKNYRGN